MGNENFYGGVGVDMLYPQGLGINTYSEPEWSSAHIVSMPPVTSHDSYQRYQAPMPAPDYQDPYPTPESTSRPPPIEVSSVPHHMVNNIPRPKSSPSTFGTNVEDLLFPENPFRFKQEEFRNDGYPSLSFPSPVPSAKSSPYFGAQPEYPTSTRTSPSRHIPIAPDPLGMRQLHAMKRMREDEEYEQTYGRKRKRTASSSGPVELNEEEQLLLKLKEEENLPWKDIATRFQTELGKTYQVPALQMRFKRLRERMRSWTDADRSKRPMITGRSASLTSSRPRCSNSVPRNVGLPSPAPVNGRSYTPTMNGSYFQAPPASLPPSMPLPSSTTHSPNPSVHSVGGNNNNHHHASHHTHSLSMPLPPPPHMSQGHLPPPQPHLPGNFYQSGLPQAMPVPWSR